MNLKRGFHRIFVVLAILWLIPVAIVDIDAIPTAAEYHRDRVFNTVNLIKDYSPQEIPKSSWTYEITDKIISEGAEQWLAKTHQKFKGQIDFSEIEQQYRGNTQNLRHEQVRVIFKGFLYWSIPLALVYLVGVVIWWITAGFCESKV